MGEKQHKYLFSPFPTRFLGGFAAGLSLPFRVGRPRCLGFGAISCGFGALTDLCEDPLLPTPSAPFFFFAFFPSKSDGSRLHLRDRPPASAPIWGESTPFCYIVHNRPLFASLASEQGGEWGCFWGNFGQKRGPSAPSSSRASQPPKMPEFPPKRATAPLVNWGGFGEFRESGAPSFPPSQTEPSWAFCLVSPPASLPSLRSQLTVWGHKA